MKKLGVLVTALAMIALLGFVGHDELHGDDFRTMITKVCIAGAVALIGMLLIIAGGRNNERG